MENILLQRFTYATITPLKNYSKIEERNKIINLNHDSCDIFDEKMFILTLPHKKNNKCYFYSNEKKDRITLKNILSHQKKFTNFSTTKEQQIKRHYGNPFSGIQIVTIERKIIKNGDKITIKIYLNIRNREVNSIYFKKTASIDSLSINLKTGNFITYSASKTKGKWVKNFRTNHFSKLNNILYSTKLFNTKKFLEKTSRLKTEFDKVFDEDVFCKLLMKSLEPSSLIYDIKAPHEFETYFIKKFVELKKIKVPNGNYSIYLKNFYPTEKFLKKNDRKLISSLLDMIGIKSKLTIKILHQNPNVDIYGLYCFCKVLGENFSNYLGNVDKRVFENSYKISENGFDLMNKNHILNDRLQNLNNLYELRENEKENLIKILNASYNSRKPISLCSFNIVIDHFDMIKKIRKYDNSIEMRAKTPDEFHQEHSYLTSVVLSIRKGWVTEYVYNQKTVDEIENPCEKLIEVKNGDKTEWIIDTENGEMLYPKILKREEEYNEEGKFMHHCVATYVDKDNSIIVSIRTKDNKDRVTCEYDISTGKVKQERYFCNGIPPKEFEYALAKVGERIKKLSMWGILNWTEKKEVPIKINNITVEPRGNSEFEEIFF